MSAVVLDGEALAAKVRAEVAEQTARLVERGVTPGLGTILVGDDVPSARYVQMKHEDCAEVGIASAHEHLPADVSETELLSVVARFNADPAIDAYLVQLPLPPPRRGAGAARGRARTRTSTACTRSTSAAS